MFPLTMARCYKVARAENLVYVNRVSYVDICWKSQAVNVTLVFLVCLSVKIFNAWALNLLGKYKSRERLIF